jgi:hypothetical protein
VEVLDPQRAALKQNGIENGNNKEFLKKTLVKASTTTLLRPFSLKWLESLLLHCVAERDDRRRLCGEKPGGPV